MVLESLFEPKKAERKPWDLFFLGLIYASIGTFLGLWIFKNQASLVMVFLSVIAAVPLMYKTIKYEEKKDHLHLKETALLKRHSKALVAFMFLFFGFLVAFSVWYLVLPDKLLQITFSAQIQTIRDINGQTIFGTLTPAAISVGGAATSAGSLFLQILSNNLKVMLFCIFFSFFYGAGAIFILTWNASVIGAAIGGVLRDKIYAVFQTAGFSSLVTHFYLFPYGLMRYMTHGVFEIGGYFAAGLAGGIISVAVVNHSLGSDHFKRTFNDSLAIISLAILLLVVGALVEVYITPVIF